MKKLGFVFLFVLLFTGIPDGKAAFPYPVRDPKVIQFRTHLDLIRDLRKQTKALYDRLNTAVESDQPLSGENLKDLDTITKSHSYFADELEKLIVEGSVAPISFLPVSETNAISTALELASYLVFTDSVDEVISIFSSNIDLRMIVNRPNPSFHRPTDVLYKAMMNYTSDKRYIRKAMLMDNFSAINGMTYYRKSPELEYLAGVIKQSATYRKYSSLSEPAKLTERLNLQQLRLELKADKAGDRFGEFTTHRVMGTLSKWFGNAVGSIQFRKGKTLGNADIAKKMKAILKPGDLLLESTPFRATSLFIPGFYGHVAMWVGNEAELVDLQIWNDPLIAPYQSKIRRGHAILEALRPGVELNPVEHFLDIDDLLILRPNQKITTDEIRSAIKSGMSHVGQGYDFNFDVNTNDKIVCSELAFKTYTGVRFRLDKSMGRWTIKPDAVAAQGLKGGAFTPVMMVRDGVVVSTDLEKALAAELGKN